MDKIGYIFDCSTTLKWWLISPEKNIRPGSSFRRFLSVENEAISRRGQAVSNRKLPGGATVKSRSATLEQERTTQIKTTKLWYYCPRGRMMVDHMGRLGSIPAAMVSGSLGLISTAHETAGGGRVGIINEGYHYSY